MVELSIVLVILGLLVGGILAGQSLIRASELRAVGTEYDRYKTATLAFRDKYFALPGDMSNATSFWGEQDPTPANCRITPSTSALTCNGNGDTQIFYASGAVEMFRFWQHLANAGLVEGQFSGISANAIPDNEADKSNVPQSRLKNGLWHIEYLDTIPTSDSSYFAGYYGNALLLGGYYGSNQPPVTSLFFPEELWNIDTKLDDGMPGTGKLVGRNFSSCATGSSASDFAALYRTTTRTAVCLAYFRAVQ